jgi:hypothetical protein
MNSAVARISGSGKKTLALITMLVERDCCRIRWMY